MPFFWVGGFGSGILSVLLAGATLVTEEIPRPETTLRFLLNLDRLKDVPDDWSDDDYDSMWIFACGKGGRPKHFELRPQHFHPSKAKP